MENKRIQDLYDKTFQLRLPQDNPLEGVPSLELSNTVETKALQFFQGNDVILEISLKMLLEEAFSEKKEPIPGLQKEKLAVQLSAKEEPAVPEASKAVTAQVNRTKAALSQAAKGVSGIQEESRTLPILERNRTLVSLPEESEISTAALSLQSETEALRKEIQAFHALQGENDKLKLQRDAIKEAIKKITELMDALQEKLKDVTFLLEGY